MTFAVREWAHRDGADGGNTRRARIQGLFCPEPRGRAVNLAATTDTQLRQQGRSSDSRIALLTAPSHESSQWQNAAFVPGYSGGSVTGSHRLPDSPAVPKRLTPLSIGSNRTARVLENKSVPFPCRLTENAFRKAAASDDRLISFRGCLFRRADRATVFTFAISGPAMGSSTNVVSRRDGTYSRSGDC